MDHVGISSGKPDSINNGADDDASGTVGVIELAEAFSRPGARPKRSVLFITVSGEEKGLWGSDYFVKHPTVPLKDIVADLNLDMIGRNWPDTIVAIGREHSDLGQTLAAVNAAHPELGMTAIDDRWPEENFYFRSDHYNFAKNGVPILFFFNGVHADYHQVSDSPDKINGGQGIADPAAAVLPRPGRGEQPAASAVESGQLREDRPAAEAGLVSGTTWAAWAALLVTAASAPARRPVAGRHEGGRPPSPRRTSPGGSTSSPTTR